MTTTTLAKRHGLAWMLLTLSLTIHVVDEAVNDFLSVYNPMVKNIRASYPFLPLPTFTFQNWILGLTLAVIVLFGLSVFAYRGNRIMVGLSYLYGGLMLVNGLTHFMGSIYFGDIMPGTWSAPLLIITSVYLISTAKRAAVAHKKRD